MASAVGHAGEAEAAIAKTAAACLAPAARAGQGVQLLLLFERLQQLYLQQDHLISLILELLLF